MQSGQLTGTLEAVCQTGSCLETGPVYTRDHDHDHDLTGPTGHLPFASRVGLGCKLAEVTLDAHGSYDPATSGSEVGSINLNPTPAQTAFLYFEGN